MHGCHTYCCLLCSCLRESARCLTRPNNNGEKDYATIFQRGLLIGCCLSGLNLMCVKCVIKCRFFYNEINSQLVKSKVALSDFYP